jgi:hypothetical protein
MVGMFIVGKNLLVIGNHIGININFLNLSLLKKVQDIKHRKTT